MPVTGTIARTVTNLRSGATSPISGLVHSLVLMLIVLLAAPLAVHVPLAVLAGVLLFVAWNMGEWREFVRLRHDRRVVVNIEGVMAVATTFIHSSLIEPIGVI
jgi:SulP family sulfate permease